MMTKFVILTSPGCVWCERAKKLLDDIQRPYTELDVTEEPGLLKFMQALDITTVPQVFDGATRIGGYENLKQALEYWYGPSTAEK